MYRTATSLLISIVSILFSFMEARAVEFNFRNYTAKDGLPSLTVYAIAQGSDGFIWMGTEEGLSRFDGYSFVNYKNISRDSASLLDNHVYSLCESPDGLWVGTEKGVCIFDHRTRSFRHFDTPATDGTAINGRIQHIHADNDGNIWVTSYRQGAFFYNVTDGTLKRYGFTEHLNPGEESGLITALHITRDGEIYASVNNTPHVIFRHDKTSGRFIPAFPRLEAREAARLASQCITEDTFGNLWLGTWTNGLAAIDDNGNMEYYLGEGSNTKAHHIHSIMELEPGKLLVGSDEGLSYLSIYPAGGSREKTRHFREPDISSRFVYPVFKDREGGLWVGTYYGGVNYASPNRNQFTGYVHDQYRNSISGNVISSFCEDGEGNLWIGTDDAGLNYLDTRTGHFTHYMPKPGHNSLSFHNIHGLAMRDDELWIGTYTGGLNVMDTRTGTFRQYYSNPADSSTIDGNSIYSVFCDDRNNIWIGTMWGINKYNPDSDTFSRMQKLNSIVIDIHQNGNRIWFATSGKGVFSYDLTTNGWRNYMSGASGGNSIVSNDVNCISTDEIGKLWFGTAAGICGYDQETDSFSYLDVDFPSNSICDIFHVNGYMWISTTKGLVKLLPKDKKFHHFSWNDGLLSSTFIPKAGILTLSGKIYLGSTQGIVSFYPKHIAVNQYAPPVEITGFQLFNIDTDTAEYAGNGGVLVLPYNKNSFSFEFSGLSYFSPEKNQYSYRLENFDKQWVDAGYQRKATYTNIPPGHYKFHVRASNNDGIWNEAGRTLSITIRPPWWLTNTMMTVYIILGAALASLFVTYMVRRSERRQNARIEDLRREQEAEAYNSKIDFFISVAHEIRTPVSLIIGPLEKIINSTDPLPEKIKGDLDIIDRNSNRLLFLTNQLLDFRRMERGLANVSVAEESVPEIIRGIFSRFQPFLEYKGIRFRFKSDSPDFKAVLDKENITKVVSNLLHNAAKYTRDHVELSLVSDTGNGEFEIRVSDNGPGIAEEYINEVFNPFYRIPDESKPGTGMGLHIVKTIVEACGGRVAVESIPGEGTTFIITLPLVGAHEGPAGGIIDETIETDSRMRTDESGGARQEAGKDDRPAILIAEDNTDMQEFLWKNFSDRYRIYVAGNGIEGLEILGKEEIDLIVSDIMMPGMDGIEFSRKVKSNFLWNHIPIVLLTAKTNTDTKIEAMETGADAYVEKPFSIGFLSARIDNLLKSRRSLQKKFSETPFMTLKSIAGNKADEKFLTSLNEILERNIPNVDFSVDRLASEMNVSSSGMFAKIRNLTGLTPNKLLLIMRLKKAAELISTNEYRVNEVAYMVGFNNPSYFAKCFHRQFGVLPNDFRKGGK